MSTLNFKNAVSDFRFLKNAGYAEKSSLKLVGDRYRLSAQERNCLLRGVVADSLAQERRAKIKDRSSLAGQAIGIDWFNVLITVESYLKGSFLFEADDGILRDAASVHASYRVSALTNKAVTSILETLASLRPRHADIFLDSPISHSKEIRDELALIFSKSARFSFTLSLVGSADYFLKTYAGFVASSDSVIIDNVTDIIDLARLVLLDHYSFHAKPLDQPALEG